MLPDKLIQNDTVINEDKLVAVKGAALIVRLTSYQRRRVGDFCAQMVILIKTLAETVGQAETKT